MPASRVLKFLVALAGAAYALAPAPAFAGGDEIFGGNGGSYENAFLRPADDAEAVRFLNQATFGATVADIAAVRGAGYEGWIEQQFARTQTLARPTLEQLARTRHDANQTIDQNDRLHRWVNTAVLGTDQLRQRVAYSMSQIIVASDQNDALNGHPLLMAEWNDLIVRNSFGNYKTLLSETSFSPVMGAYLTHLRNRKFELTTTCSGSCNTSPQTITGYDVGNNGASPDENYAREIMQLFSIGLVTRNMDFSIVEDPGNPGQPLPTYDQAMITTLSRVFTGLAYDCTGNATVQGISIARSCGTNCVGTQCRFSNRDTLFFNSPPRADLPNGNDSSLIHPDYYRPLVCYPRYNDNGRDQSNGLVNTLRRGGFELPGPNATNPTGATIAFSPGEEVPPGTPPRGKELVLSGESLTTIPEFKPGLARNAVPYCGATTLSESNDSERAECINYCENNVRTVVDQLFEHPNVAPFVARQLIQRLVTSNPSPEYIERVACAFEGTAAPASCTERTTNARGDMKAMVKAVLLDVEARQAPTAPNVGKEKEPMLKMIALWRAFGGVSPDNRRWFGDNFPSSFLQRPLGAPSVFNFYEPDYQQPGAIRDANLYSPEFQIINETTVMNSANQLFSRVCRGYGGGNDCRGSFTQPANTTNNAYIPAANLDSLPGMACGTTCTGPDDASLIEAINARLMGGTMSGAIANTNSCTSGNSGMKGVYFNLLRCGLSGTLGQTGTNAARDARRRKALYLIHLTLISPEYGHQR
jgi:uncharacterized protein (DUF1800 family)